MAANLSIRTNPPALVEVHDAEYRQRDVGLSPRELKNVSKGRYVVSATMKNGQVI